MPTVIIIFLMINYYYRREKNLAELFKAAIYEATWDGEYSRQQVEVCSAHSGENYFFPISLFLI